MVDYKVFDLAFYWSLVVLLFFFFLVWKPEARNEELKDVKVLTLVTLFFCSLLLLLGAGSFSFTTVNLCDHYEVVDGKKVCVPIKEFSLPAPYLLRTELKSPSGVIYSEDGERIGEVPLRVVREKVGSEDPKLVVELTDEVGRKMVRALERGEDEFYLYVLTGGKLWKVVRFEVEK